MRSSGSRHTSPVTVPSVDSTDRGGTGHCRSGPIRHNGRVNLGIVIPLVILPIAVVAAFAWYRRSIANLQPGESKPLSGQRLTAEALHRVPSPPWRVVYEISDALGDIDHVVIGPSGAIAVTTTLGDRPDPGALIAERGDAVLTSEAAIARGPLDELLRAVDASCDLSARVFWGAPAPGEPAGVAVAHGSVLVEGQRLGDWLSSLTDTAQDDPTGITRSTLDQVRIDEIWRTIVIGIGRPDPLS